MHHHPREKSPLLNLYLRLRKKERGEGEGGGKSYPRDGREQIQPDGSPEARRGEARLRGGWIGWLRWKEEEDAAAAAIGEEEEEEEGEN
jgi:hypothetical protein